MGRGSDRREDANSEVEKSLSGRGHGIPDDVIAQNAFRSLLTMLTWWLDQNQPCSPEKMKTAYMQLVESSGRRALGVV